MKIRVKMLLFAACLTFSPAKAELELPTVLPTSSFLAMDATITKVENREDSFQIEIHGKMAMPPELSNLARMLANSESYHIFIVKDNALDNGKFLVLTEKAEAAQHRPCTVDILTTGYSSSGSGITLHSNSTKIDVRLH